MNIKKVIKSLAEMPDKFRYEKRWNAKRGNYEEWLRVVNKSLPQADQEEMPDPFRVSKTDYLMQVICAYFKRHPETLILYGDEDEVASKGRYQNPWFKPDWSPELMESFFYLGSLIAIQGTFLERAMPNWRETIGRYLLSGQELRKKEAADLYVFCDDELDDDFQTTVTELCREAGGWEKGCQCIKHLHGILHHCKSKRTLSEKMNENFQKRVRESDEKQFLNIFQSDEPASKRTFDFSMAGDLKRLSVIIPSKDNPELLGKCLLALQQASLAWHKTTVVCEDDTLSILKEDVEHETSPYEVIVVDNGSSEENKQAILELQKNHGFQYLYEPMEFDFARMCNLGAKAAKGDFLLFLNDDVELLPKSNLSKMIELSDRDGVGSVGLKLYYPNSDKIQHAGITNLPMGPVHKLQFLEDEENYYFGMNRGRRNVLAVTAACVMLRADRFWEAGGFDESLKVAFNDVALGFRLYELGYRNVCMCDAYAYHHESLTRGSDGSPEKLERLLKERDRLFALFPNLAGKDPYYSPFLGRQGLDVRVRPAYETMNNHVQEIKAGDILKQCDLSNYREDACLYVCVEDERQGEITGYALVLLDDNACYERKLLLQDDNGAVMAIRLEEQYRPDLRENHLGQRHVALCGFWCRVSPDSLPAGRYRIGVMATRTVGNMRLISWTPRQLWVKRDGSF